LVETEVRTPTDLTEKALHRLDDGRLIRSVLMRYPRGAGAAVEYRVHLEPGRLCRRLPVLRHRGSGFMRDLATAEIVDQVRFWQRRLTAGAAHHQRRVHGHGRATAQHRRRDQAAAALTDAARFGLGARHI
jgi:adenine C2-methylase RlmN of 23S rRNA A2503 and tRNA A37